MRTFLGFIVIGLVIGFPLSINPQKKSIGFLDHRGTTRFMNNMNEKIDENYEQRNPSVVSRAASNEDMEAQ